MPCCLVSQVRLTPAACRYVYERLTLPGKKPTFVTLMVTQLVSGVWHGLYPGYIMFFAGRCCAAAAAAVAAVSAAVFGWHALLAYISRTQHPC
jgi:lysophospholipid acyltransferase